MDGDLAQADIVFVHIPKTGGTSLRDALVRARPRALALSDYGPTNPATSAQVKALRYGDGGSLDRLRQGLPAERPVTVSGHVNAMKYAKAFRGAALVTVLREPVERVVSEYLHLRQHEGYGGALMDYAAQPASRDRQAAFVDRVALDRFAVVGVHERLDAAAEALGRRLGAPLVLKRLNVTPARGRPEVTPAMRAQILAWNPTDAALYAAALSRAA